VVMVAVGVKVAAPGSNSSALAEPGRGHEHHSIAPNKVAVCVSLHGHAGRRRETFFRDVWCHRPTIGLCPGHMVKQVSHQELLALRLLLRPIHQNRSAMLSPLWRIKNATTSCPCRSPIDLQRLKTSCPKRRQPPVKSPTTAEVPPDCHSHVVSAKTTSQLAMLNSQSLWPAGRHLELWRQAPE